MANYEMLVDIATKAEAEKRTKDMINMSKALGRTVEGDLKVTHAVFSGNVKAVDAYVEDFAGDPVIMIEMVFTGKNVHSAEVESDKIVEFTAMPPFKDASVIDTLNTILDDQFRGTNVKYNKATKAEAKVKSTHGTGELDIELLAKYLVPFYAQLLNIDVTVASFDRTSKAGRTSHYYSLTTKDVLATVKTIQDGGSVVKPVVDICI